MTIREIILLSGLLISGKLFAQTVPVRLGIIPGLSTQGKSDTQTISNFSFNLLGGSTGSVKGLEVGSLFNINKKNIQYVQVAGLFNMTGGFAEGVQTAGLYNTVRYSLTGAQVAGIANVAGKDVQGIQVSGIYNHIGGILKGMQIAGVANYTRQQVNGVQLAGVVNYTPHLKGVQIGLINIADTSEGYGIGLINIVRKGYHKISVYTSEVLNTNIAFKTGSAKLYNIFFAGVNAGSHDRVFSYGYGLGHEFSISKHFTINPELTAQYMYLGRWNYTNILSKFHLQLNYQVAMKIAIFGGPSFAVFYSDQPGQRTGYKFRLPNSNYHNYDLGANTVGWIGWNAGITFL